MKLQERLMAPYRQKVRWKLVICYAALLITCAVTTSEAQSLKRQSIGVCGTNMLAEGVLVKQTVGQPYATTTSYSAEVSFLPGFQQPNTIQVSMQHSSGPGLYTLSIYPNPATHIMKISSRESIKNATLLISDSQGRVLLYEKVADLNNYTLNCESWTSGYYMISIVDEQHQKYSSKLIITK